MFPTTVTIHNVSDLQKVLCVLFPTTPAEAPADTKPKRSAAVKAEEKAAVLSAEQQAAVDDTAGLGNAQPAATARTEPTAEVVKADAPAPKAVSYAELQAKVLALHKLDSTAAKPIAVALGFENFKAMPEDKWPLALEKVQAALSERGV